MKAVHMSEINDEMWEITYEQGSNDQQRRLANKQDVIGALDASEAFRRLCLSDLNYSAMNVMPCSVVHPHGDYANATVRTHSTVAEPSHHFHS